MQIQNKWKAKIWFFLSKHHHLKPYLGLRKFEILQIEEERSLLQNKISLKLSGNAAHVENKEKPRLPI